MKTMKIFLFGLLLLIGLGSCSILSITNRQMMQIKEGMTLADVKKILGTPDYRRFNGEFEEWEYRWSKTHIIRFYDGEVSGMDSFATPVSSCQEHTNTAPH